MQYALINDFRTLPAKGLKGICPGCGKEVVAKCGNIKVHHWAHIHIKDCDSWSELETEWHRQWKNHFPLSFQEVSFTDEVSGEIHRADVHTPNGITLEFQNSPLSITELESREAFYDKLVWVVNGIKFKDRIEATCNIPDPQSELLSDWDFAVDENGFAKHLIFHKKTDLLSSDPMVRLYGTNDKELIEAKRLLGKSAALYRAIIWRYKHRAWLEAKAPVFLDFGHDHLFWLKSRKQVQSEMFYIMAIKKADFINKYSGQSLS